MELVIDIIGIVLFIGIAWVFSADRKHINWLSVGLMTGLNILIAFILTWFSWGRAIVEGCAKGFTWLVSVADKGINFALGWWQVNPVDHSSVNFIVSALLPILLVVPLFDTLTYIGFLPWLIKWIGKGLSFITRQPKFETFFAVEMMFLGNTEALAVSKVQLQKMKPARNVTLALMSMSCVTASILAAYVQMVPGQYVMTAVPLNCINALIVSSVLYPVQVTPEEDVIYGVADSQETPAEVDAADAAVAAEDAKEAKGGAAVSPKTAAQKEQLAYDELPWYKKMFTHNPSKPKKEPYFSFLGDSILGAGKLILIIIANVIAFVALAALIDKILGAIWKPLSLESILGVFMFIPAWFLGLDPGTAWQMAQVMGLKLITNEFVAMGQVSKAIVTYAPHYKAVLTVFLTSFANLGTLGMIIGCFKGMVDKEKNDLVSKAVLRMFLSGILVSLLSAGMVGLFVW